MAEVELLDEFGNLRVIDETEVPQALAAGWRAEAPQETQARLESIKYGTVGQKLTGVGERALSGASLGLSDVALTELGGEDYRAAAAARQRQLGIIGEGAELAGALAPLILSGGSSAPATGLRVVGAPVRGAAALGRLGEVGTGAALRGIGIEGKSIVGAGLVRGAELGVGGAIEGGIYGAGQTLSEAALAPGGDYNHLAEKMFAGAEEGAKFGFLVGGGLGFLGGAGGKAIERGAEKLVGPQGLKNLLQRTSDEATIRAVGGMSSREAAIAGESGTTKMATELRAHTLDDGQRLFTPGASKEQLFERLNKAVPETGAKLGALRKEVSDAIETSGRVDLRPELGGFFKGVDDMVAAAEMGPRSLFKRAQRAQREVAGLRTAYAEGRATLEDVTAYRIKLDQVIRPPTKGGGIAIASKNAAELEHVRGLLEKSIETSVAKSVNDLMPTRLGEYEALKTRFAALKNAQKLSSRSAAREMTASRFNLPETLVGAVGLTGTLAGGGVLPAAASVAFGVGKRLWQSRGESVLAVLADRAARAESGGRGATKAYMSRLAQARRGAIGSVSGGEVERKGRVERVLKQKAAETAQRAYNRRLTQIVNFAPDKLSGFNELAASAPQTAAASVALMTRARQYLLQTAPTNALEADPLQPQLKKPNPNPVMLEKWARRVEAAQDPVGTLKHGLQTGSLTREHVETFKLVYPVWFEARRSELSEALLQSKERLPYQERIKLGVLFELPTDPAIEPRQLARTQAMYQQAAAEAPPPPAPTPKADTTMAQRYASESQRLEQNIPPM